MIDTLLLTAAPPSHVESIEQNRAETDGMPPTKSGFLNKSMVLDRSKDEGEGEFGFVLGNKFGKTLVSCHRRHMWLAGCNVHLL